MAADKFTAEEVAAALTKTRGMKTLAARELGCTYNTVQRYIDKYPTVKAALKEAHESLGDSVELTLVNEALGQRDKQGRTTRDPNITALIFLAKTKFKARGFVERQENVNFNVDTELLKRTLDAIEQAGMSASDVFESIIQQAAQVDAADVSGDGDRGGA